ncbi:hypothetical protein D3C87_189460 [compost metagenome]
MKKLMLLAILAAFVQPAAAADSKISIEEYYEITGRNFTPEQWVIAKQNIKLVHLLDAILPEDPDSTMQHITGTTPDGETCYLSRNKSDMFLDDPSNPGDKMFTPYHFSWDPNDMGSNLKGKQIVGDFKATSNTVEATAKVPWSSGIFNVPARIGLRLEILNDNRVSIQIRHTYRIFDQYATCIFKK